MTPQANLPQNFDPAAEALTYLREQLGPRAPDSVTPAGQYDESPLEGEGRTWLFSFLTETGTRTTDAECDRAQRDHFVAVGETVPNYFPAFGLSSDDAYSFHIGTRFLLEMQLQKVGDELEPPDGRALLLKIIADGAPNAIVADLALAALFRCAEGYFAVYRLRIDGVAHYAMGGDCPPGFYQLVQYPPQTVLRLHLGKVIRAEAKTGT